MSKSYSISKVLFGLTLSKASSINLMCTWPLEVVEMRITALKTSEPREDRPFRLPN